VVSKWGVAMAVRKGLMLLVLIASPAWAAEPPAAKSAGAESSTPSKQEARSSRQEVRRALEAARAVQQALKDYAQGTGSLTAYYRAQQTLTAVEIACAAATSNLRGNPELSDYLARRAEVAALERARSEVLAVEVAEGEADVKREELARYADALKLAHKQLAVAEKHWKTAERANQLRYLNRRAVIAR
jgi:hypothetical protein